MKDFILPDIGEGIVECELLKWLVAEGDIIKEDQPVAEVMTDKATVEIPAMHSGVVAKLYYKEGDIAKVHSALFAMQDDSDINNEVAKTDDNVENTNDTISSVPKVSEDTASNTVACEHIEAFILPDIGEGVVECEIMQWHVSEGDDVIEDQAIVEVMTDKAIVEIPAKHSGKIVKLYYQKGDIAAVHSPLFDQLIGTGENTTAPSKPNQSSSVPINTSVAQTNNKQGESFEPPIDIGRAIASPAVRRLARENKIDLSTIKATGSKGRVLKQDILQMLSGASAPQSIANTVESSSTTGSNTRASETHALNTNGNVPQDRVEAVKGIRAAMAKQMVASVSTIPHFAVSDELCMDKLIALRERLKPEFAAHSVKISFMPFFIKALSLALTQFPIINSRLNNEANELTYVGAHNIGVAVDSKIGLMVPNIKNVQTLSLFEVAQAMNSLIDRARDGKLNSNDLSGGTISISNVGTIGGINAAPLINKPEVAIVALGKTRKLPRFDSNDNVVASQIMTVNWSGDHRVIDGATMVKFNNLWMEYLADPEKMLVHLR